MTTRDKFVARFGEDDALRVEEAARGHRREDNPVTPLLSLLVGDQVATDEDQFLCDLSTCISYECVNKYHHHHGFVASEDDLRRFVVGVGGIPERLRDPQGIGKYDGYTVD